MTRYALSLSLRESGYAVVPGWGVGSVVAVRGRTRLVATPTRDDPGRWLIVAYTRRGGWDESVFWATDSAAALIGHLVTRPAAEVPW